MTTKIGAALVEFVELLTAANVNAVADPRDLELPGIWVTINQVDFAALSGERYEMAFDCYLIAMDNGVPASLDQLSDQLTALTAAVNGNVSAQPITVTMPNHSADPLPALLVTITTEIT